MRNVSLGKVVVLAVASILLLLPITAVAAQHHAAKRTCVTTKHGKVHALAASAGGPVIAFGQYGGNMRPWDAAMDADGTVTAKDITVGEPHLAMPADTLNGLLKLADTDGFWSMAKETRCAGTLPDIASRYIQITSNTGTRRVDVHGACVPAFNQLFAMLMASGDVHF